MEELAHAEIEELDERGKEILLHFEGRDGFTDKMVVETYNFIKEKYDIDSLSDEEIRYTIEMDQASAFMNTYSESKQLADKVKGDGGKEFENRLLTLENRDILNAAIGDKAAVKVLHDAFEDFGGIYDGSLNNFTNMQYEFLTRFDTNNDYYQMETESDTEVVAKLYNQLLAMLNGSLKAFAERFDMTVGELRKMITEALKTLEAKGVKALEPPQRTPFMMLLNQTGY